VVADRDDRADIKALTLSSPNVVAKLSSAFEKYNEEQFVTVKLPGGSQPVRHKE
jgi:capping protein (actin filament) muscle Z-line, alpha